jgi:adenylyltransferase/sulfurtransferase
MNDNQLLRYARHIMLPELDVAGQERLLDAHVLIVGLGGLGSPIALYLAASGIGRLTLIDDDRVDLSNLQRQIIHATPDVGSLKTDSAAASIAALNPDCGITTLHTRLDAEGIEQLLPQVDLVLDASDNFDTRYMINAACVAAQIPLISGAAIRWEGQIAVFDFRDPDAPCYACLYPDTDDADAAGLNCAENGVAAPLVGVIGSLQALEAVKLIAGIGETLSGYLLVMDAKSQQWQRLRLTRDPDCKLCSNRTSGTNSTSSQ